MKSIQVSSLGVRYRVRSAYKHVGSIWTLIYLILAQLPAAGLVVTVSHDTYLRAGQPDTVNGSDDNLKLKSQAGSFDRTAYLRFDSEEFSKASCATLLLGIQEAHDDFNITVYGIKEGNPDEDFNEATLTPKNSATFEDSVDSVIDDTVVNLGTFVMPAGFETRLNFTSEAFLNFIKSDTNGIVTLILYRQEDHVEVTNIASKEADFKEPPRIALSTGIKWLDGTGGKFQEVAKWEGQEVPDTSQGSLFGLGGEYTVLFDQDVTNTSSTIKSGNVTFDLQGKTYSLKEDDALTVNANLELKGGRVRTTAGSSGEVRVGTEGNDSHLQLAKDAQLVVDKVTVGEKGQLTAPLFLYVGVEPGSALAENRKLVADEIQLNGGAKMVSAQGLISGASSGDGELVVSGEGSRWALTRFFDTESDQTPTLDPILAVGSFLSSYQGILKIEDGGVVDAENPDVGPINIPEVTVALFGKGRIDVRGKGDNGPSRIDATLLTVGGEGEGILNVLKGGLVTSEAAQVGFWKPKGKGTVLVVGEGSKWMTGDQDSGKEALILGPGEARLFVEGRGVVQVKEAPFRVTGTKASVLIKSGGMLESLGGSFIGDLIVVRGKSESGQASLWKSGTTIFGLTVPGAASDFKAKLVIADGAKVESDLVIMDTNSTAVVTGTGSLWTVDTAGEDFRIGEEAKGTITVKNNAKLEVTGNILLRWGQIVIGAGSTVTATSLLVESGGIINGSGTLNVEFENIQNIGTIAPNLLPNTENGNSPSFSPLDNHLNQTAGVLTIEGGLNQGETGMLLFQIRGTEAGVDHDQLVVTGNADIQGKILLKFLDGFAPRAGDEFQFVSAGGELTIDIEEVITPNLAPGFEYELTVVDGKSVFKALTDGVYLPSPDVEQSAQFTEDEAVHIQLNGGGLGDSLILEQSFDMVHWEEEQRLLNLGQALEFLTDVPEDTPRVFYRVVVNPTPPEPPVISL